VVNTGWFMDHNKVYANIALKQTCVSTQTLFCHDNLKLKLILLYRFSMLQVYNF